MTKTHSLLKRVSYAVIALAIAVVPVLQSTHASAAQITARSVTLSNSVSGATGVTYAFAFSIPSSTLVKSVGFQFCDTASQACVTPGSFAAGSAAISAGPTGLGSGGAWTSNNSANSIRILNASNTGTAAGAVTVSFNAVTNPTLANGTFYIHITTYSDAAWTTPIDSGVVVASTAGLVTVNATVDETLTFTLAASTVTLSPTSITSAAASTGTSTLVASTNAASGYTITYSSPNSLKPAGGTALSAYSSTLNPAPGTAGFGINLKANTTAVSTPAVGSNPSGGSGAATGIYATADTFSLVANGTAQQIASAGAATNATTYTVSYLANVAALTAPGAYTTTFTYVATPNF